MLEPDEPIGFLLGYAGLGEKMPAADLRSLSFLSGLPSIRSRCLGSRRQHPRRNAVTTRKVSQRPLARRRQTHVGVQKPQPKKTHGPVNNDFTESVIVEL